MGTPKKIIIFSRDEAKQHMMRLSYMNKNPSSTEEIIYQNFSRLIEFRIGDIRDFNSVLSVVSKADIIINTAALKQVPACEYFPYEAVRTNIQGAENIVRAICNHNLPVNTVIGISTDKAAKPVNVMGMSKALQERVFIRANIDKPTTRFIAVRYGNVLASRGSVIPFFHEQIKKGGPITITDPEMTRFLLNLNQAVDIIFAALTNAAAGEIYVPIVPSANIIDIANALIEDRKIEKVVTGIRPGEKLHEILVSEEEAHRTFMENGHYVIPSVLPEINRDLYKSSARILNKEYSSSDNCMNEQEVYNLLKDNNLLISDSEEKIEELLR